MKVFLTGGTGFVGKEIIKELANQGYMVKVLVRNPNSVPNEIQLDNIEFHQGDIFDEDSLVSGLEGCASCIHLIGIIREKPSEDITFSNIHINGTENIINATKKAGIKRYIHMSALGAEEDAKSDYHRSKYEAEKLVKESGLDYTIIRPSVIFGPKDEFANKLAGIIRLCPVFPVFGEGNYSLQPVSIYNIAECFVNSIDKHKCYKQVYEVGGPHQLTYKDIVNTISNAVKGKTTPLISVPISLVKLKVSLMERFSFFPITMVQLTMLLEGNTCSLDKFKEDFDIELIPFGDGIRKYL